MPDPASKNILIIEDEDDILRLVAIISVESLGYTLKELDDSA
jgi:hypothetical protein